MEIIDKARDNHWFWDTEILVLAQRFGYRVKEIPVRWRQGESKVRVSDSVYMLLNLLKFRWRLSLGDLRGVPNGE
jgi:hypothetical protein